MIDMRMLLNESIKVGLLLFYSIGLLAMEHQGAYKEKQLKEYQVVLQNTTQKALDNWETIKLFLEDFKLTSNIIEIGGVETSGKFLYPLHKTLVKQYAHKIPFFLVYECIEKSCVFSRNRDPKNRQQFQENCCTLLQEKINNKRNKKASTTSPVVYASFGSGTLFQDLVTLTALLDKNPKELLDVHLIDIEYQAYVDHLDKNDLSREFKTSTQYNNLDWYWWSYSLNTKKARFEQFAFYFERNFTGSQIVLHIFGSANDYLAHIKNKKIKLPDVLSAIDIDGNATVTDKGYKYRAESELARETFKELSSALRTLNPHLFIAFHSYIPEHNCIVGFVSDKKNQ